MTRSDDNAHAYVVCRCEDGCDHDDKHRWFTTKPEALTYARTLVGRYHYAQITALTPGGEVQSECIEWQPEPYNGETKRAFISVPLNGRNGAGGYVHRQPVDCTLPTRFDHGDAAPQLNEERTYWVVRTEHGDTWKDVQHKFAGRWGDCQCGTWQEIEGIPAKVDELVAKYPPAVTL